ncbi:hypothetical protein OHB23_10415 [Rhodococcus sp. NBC_00294]|nr:hypothetical protein [Rhodococcus sp. NBC_00294]
MDHRSVVTQTDISSAVRRVVDTAATEAGRFADRVVGTGPLPGTREWEVEQDTSLPADRARAWHLLSLRVQVAAGLDGIETVVVLRMQGTTWAAIGEAVGMSRQSAHERWSSRANGVLDPMGTGLPPIATAD